MWHGVLTGLGVWLCGWSCRSCCRRCAWARSSWHGCAFWLVGAVPAVVVFAGQSLLHGLGCLDARRVVPCAPSRIGTGRSPGASGTPVSCLWHWPQSGSGILCIQINLSSIGSYQCLNCFWLISICMVMHLPTRQINAPVSWQLPSLCASPSLCLALGAELVVGAVKQGNFYC